VRVAEAGLSFRRFERLRIPGQHFERGSVAGYRFVHVAGLVISSSLRQRSAEIQLGQRPVVRVRAPGFRYERCKKAGKYILLVGGASGGPAPGAWRKSAAAVQPWD
jgi:hypothetical protein